MATVKQRLEEFYALGGQDYGEVLRKLNTFGRTLNLDKSAFFGTITTHNWRDELFYIKLLQMHKMYAVLTSILLKGHVISSKLILKDTNFIKYLYKHSLTLTTKLPNPLRTKLINKLSYVIDDEDKGFELFSLIINEFGLKIATPLLISCKENVITEAITVNGVKFTERQLIHCHQKSAQLLEIYFKENPCFDRYPKLGQYLCMHDLKTFQNLLKHGAPKIGRKAFVRYLKEYKADFVRDCYKLKNLIKPNVLGRYLNESEFVVLLKSVDDFGIDWDLEQLLVMVPRNIRGRVIFAAFKELYGFEISTPSKELLRLITLEDRRRFDLSGHVEFESTDIAIPTLEHQLEFATEADVRMELIRKMLECCKLNNDLDALLKVLQNHANEHQSIRCGFINRINEYFRLDRFSGEHWSCIDQMITMIHVNGENVFCIGHTLDEFMAYKIKKGLDYTLQMKLFCKLREAYSVPMLSENPEVQKCVLLKYRSLMDEVFEGDAKRTSQLTYLSAVIDFNVKHPNFKIPLRNCKEDIKVALEEISSSPNRVFYKEKELLRSVFQHQEELDEILLEILVIKNAPDTIIWFLRRKPCVLERNIDALFKRNTFHDRFCYELSKMRNLSLHTKMIDYALALLKSSGEDVKEIWNSVKLLSFHNEVDLDQLARKWRPNP